MPPVSPYRRARPTELNFEDLVRPHVEYLYRLAWRFTASVPDAEDLIQDVLLKLYPRTEEMLGIQRLRPWLARVLYHQYVDSVRRRARSPVLQLVTEGDGEDDPLDKVPTMREILRRVRAGISVFPKALADGIAEGLLQPLAPGRVDPAQRGDFTFVHSLRVRWAEVDRQDVVFKFLRTAGPGPRS